MSENLLIDIFDVLFPLLDFIRHWFYCWFYGCISDNYSEAQHKNKCTFALRLVLVVVSAVFQIKLLVTACLAAVLLSQTALPADKDDVCSTCLSVIG